MAIYRNDDGRWILSTNNPDVVEVVRCKNCIYYGDYEDGKDVCSMMIIYPTKPTDYCSLGEKKEDAETN